MLIPRRLVDTFPHEFRELLLPWATGIEPPSPDIIQTWEQSFAASVDRQHGIVTGSGRFAMKLILSGLKLSPGSEIIIPAYTLKDLIPLMKALELIPIPADIDPDHWNVTAETVNRKITPRTSAVLVLHLFGNPCPVDEITKLAKLKNIRVIEDCAHSAGSTLHGRPTGNLGNAAFFSFESIKPINTYGGGMIVTDEDHLATEIKQAAAKIDPGGEIAAKVRAALFERFMFRSGLARIPLTLLASSDGQRVMTLLYRLIQPPPSGPKGYIPIQASLGLKRLETLNQRVAERRLKAALLRSMLPSSCRPQQEIPGGNANYYFFVVKVDGEKESLRRSLLKKGIDAGIGAEIADDCAAILSDMDCPNAAELYKKALHLPLHEQTSHDQLVRMAQILNDICG
ncbi:MAG: aminotransferase class I/II-fold pyridoxal phosphate-dependent enzyme [Proteobacteria bacterium]|nr:aminotransferase class I/II-fold pyridoxal phosphate-dependent enzyme [Pseudomonadota bacterium]MBU1686727.1 aminotransferase class I/II-fold pyridoxal phosphate-dependent enzyme [Pseudomonadota bacterium]